MSTCNCRREILRPGGAAKLIGIVVDAQRHAEAAAGQRLLHILEADPPEAACGEGRAERPGRARPVGREIQPPVAGADPDQDLIVREIGLLHGEAHAIGEAHHGGANGRRQFVPLGDLAGGSEIRIGPALGLLDRGRGDRRGMGLAVGGAERGLAALDRGWRGQIDHWLAAEHGARGRVDPLRCQPGDRGLEDTQILGRGGEHVVIVEVADHRFGERVGRAGGGAGHLRDERGAELGDLARQFRLGHAILHEPP